MLSQLDISLTASSHLFLCLSVLGFTRACSHQFSSDVYKDLEWFITFASSFNCNVLLLSAPREDWVIECDSTLQFSKSAFYANVYPEEVTNLCSNINGLEAFDLVHASLFLMPLASHNFNIIINTENL